MTPIELAFIIKDSDTSHKIFNDALSKIGDIGQTPKKSILNKIDDCVREEKAINIIIEKLCNPNSIQFIGEKEKQLFINAYNLYIEYLISKNKDVSNFEIAFKQLINLI